MSAESENWHPGARVEALLERDVIQPIEDFQDPSQEWRRLFSECFGTFLLVLVACGGGVMGHAFPDTISRTAAVTAPGLMVLGIILFMGKVSARTSTPRSASPSGFAATSRAARSRLHRDAADRRVTGGALRPTRRQRLGQVWLQLSGGRLLIDERHADGSGADARPGERDPGHGLGRPEPRGVRSARRRWLHHSGRPLGEPDLGGQHEPRSHLRTRPDRRRLHELLGVHRWPAGGRGLASDVPMCCADTAAARRDRVRPRAGSSPRSNTPTRTSSGRARPSCHSRWRQPRAGAAPGSPPTGAASSIGYMRR